MCFIMHIVHHIVICNNYHAKSSCKNRYAGSRSTNLFSCPAASCSPKILPTSIEHPQLLAPMQIVSEVLRARQTAEISLKQRFDVALNIVIEAGSSMR